MMRTITFYSYKGGVGRSLALANIAYYFSMLGQNVVTLDFDLEAPGLHYKFLPEYNQEKRGVVDIIHDAVSKGELPEKLDDYLIDVARYPGREEHRGWIRLLPAGNAPHPSYWKKLSHIDWHALFYGKENKDDQPPGMALFLEIQRLIEQTLQPDYLLIDARTGITEVGGIALSMLADDVVCLMNNNIENKEGVRAVMRSLKRAPRILQETPLRMFPVVSRIPSSLSSDEEIELTQQLLDFLNAPCQEEDERLDEQEIFVFHSEPLLLLEEVLVILNDNTKDETPLLGDYLKLFARLLPEEAVTTHLEPLLKKIPERAFSHPHAVQKDLETLTFLYPHEKTYLMLLQFYRLARIEGSRLMNAFAGLAEHTDDRHHHFLSELMDSLYKENQHFFDEASQQPHLELLKEIWLEEPSNTEAGLALAGSLAGVGDEEGVREICDRIMKHKENPGVDMITTLISLLVRANQEDKVWELIDANKNRWSHHEGFIESWRQAVLRFFVEGRLEEWQEVSLRENPLESKASKRTPPPNQRERASRHSRLIRESMMLGQLIQEQGIGAMELYPYENLQQLYHAYFETQHEAVFWRICRRILSSRLLGDEIGSVVVQKLREKLGNIPEKRVKRTST